VTLAVQALVIQCHSCRQKIRV